MLITLLIVLAVILAGYVLITNPDDPDVRFQLQLLHILLVVLIGVLLCNQ